MKTIKKNIQETSKITNPGITKENVIWNLDNMSKNLINAFEKTEEKEYQMDKESVDRLRLLSWYFNEDEKFYNSLLLNKDFNTPSLKKGLLIIGDYGIGKSALLRTLPILTGKRITYDLASELVTEYESLSNPEDRKLFFNRNTFGRRIFDDIANEKMASNFGKTNLLKTIFENRYNKKSSTYCICNYDDNYPLNLGKALDKLGIFYGPRVYDRLFEMFNIIEFNGSSFRGK